MSVSWQDIARKDFEDVVRSKLLWGLTFGFVGLLVFFLVVGYVAGDAEGATMNELLAGMGQFVIFFIPLIALIAGFMSIVGERQSGSIRVLLSYPFSRSEVITGKLVGRSLVVAGLILIGYLVMTILGIPLTEDIALLELGLVAGVTVILGVTFTAIGVGISAATSRRGTALAWVVGIFFFLLVMWEALTVGIYYLVNGHRPGLEVEAWYLGLAQLNPLEGYRIAVAEITDHFVYPMVGLGLEELPLGEASPEDLTPESRVGGDLPFYLQPWVSVLAFFGWIAAFLLIGYRRFNRADLD